MIKRRISKQISIGDVKIGGGAPISVQTMCNTDTRDIESTLNQIKEFEQAGCDIVRLAVLNKDAAAAIKELVKKSTEYYNKNAKPGSMLSKANMVKQYNEKN